MSDREALAVAVADHPADDTPRLAFADWLDEHGEPERAVFVRAHCEAARARPGTRRRAELLDRADDLLAEHEADWLGEWRERLADWEFRRGFLHRVRMTADTFLRHGAELFRREPVVRVEFATAAGEPLDADAVRAVVGHPAFGFVRECAVVPGRFFRVTPVGAWLAAIAESPHVTRLRRFGPTPGDFFNYDPHPNVRSDGLTREAVEAFCTAERLRTLEALDLPVARHGSGDRRLWLVPAVAEAPFAANLRRLVLTGCGVPVEGFRRVAGDPVFGRLRRVEMGGNPGWKEGHRLLWHSATLTGLRSAAISADQLREYATSPLAGRVRALTVGASNNDDLDSGHRGQEDWLTLVSHAPPPCRLTLSCVNPGREVFAAMRRDGWLRHVRRLEIRGDSQYEVYSGRTAGVRVLFGRRVMPRLASLTIHEACDQRVRAALGRWPGTARLEALELTDDYTGRCRASDLAGFPVSPAPRRLAGVWAMNDADIDALLGLPGLEAVRDLNLWLVPEWGRRGGTAVERVTPAAVERLVRSPRLDRLQRLRLGFHRVPALMDRVMRLFGDPTVLPRLRVFEPHDYMTGAAPEAVEPARRRFGPRMRGP